MENVSSGTNTTASPPLLLAPRRLVPHKHTLTHNAAQPPPSYSSNQPLYTLSVEQIHIFINVYLIPFDCHKSNEVQKAKEEGEGETLDVE